MMISAPTQPYKTARPRKLITLIACFFGGLILAAGAALLREAQDDRFSSAEQVAYLLDLPVLASFEKRPSRIPLELIAFGGHE
jgi:capsular polysaccharide biosynthesis protein